MVVTAQEIIDSVSLYIPAQNILTNDDMLVVANRLILKFGDSDDKLPTLQCEFLKAIGNINKVLSGGNTSSIKREKLGDHEIEYLTTEPFDWEDYVVDINNDICPALGVSKKYTIGAVVNSQVETPIITPCYNSGTLL